MTQAILKPETELEVGLEYTMSIESIGGSPEYESISKDNNITGESEPAIYKVVAEKDFTKPQLSSQPKELKKTFVAAGCGPSIHIEFSNPSKDNSDIIIKTTVKNLRTGTETTYYIQPDKDTIKVGHDMCSGAFSFDEGDNYEVEFSFMDASGNFTFWTGERIKFTAPTSPNEE